MPARPSITATRGVAVVERRGRQAGGRLREQQRGPAVDGDGAVDQADALHHRQAFGVVGPHREGGDERQRRAVLDLDHHQLATVAPRLDGVRPAAPRRRSGTRIAVSTTGAAPTRRWRTAISREGRCQRSSAPIHQSSDQPSNQGVTSPRGSTIGSHGEPTLPTIVQLRWVRFTRNGRWPRGTNAGAAGSSWRCSQYGHTQSTPSCAADRVRSARSSVRAPTGNSSLGSWTSKVSPRR